VPEARDRQRKVKLSDFDAPDAKRLRLLEDKNAKPNELLA
jgi:hypothetical protein